MSPPSSSASSERSVTTDSQTTTVFFRPPLCRATAIPTSAGTSTMVAKKTTHARTAAAPSKNRMFRRAKPPGATKTTKLARRPTGRPSNALYSARQGTSPRTGPAGPARPAGGHPRGAPASRPVRVRPGRYRVGLQACRLRRPARRYRARGRRRRARWPLRRVSPTVLAPVQRARARSRHRRRRRPRASRRGRSRTRAARDLPSPLTPRLGTYSGARPAATRGAGGRL